MTWHTDVAMLRGYQDGALGAAHAASVEAHLAACADCRAEIAKLADWSRLDRGWGAIADRLDETSVSPIERLLARLGITEHRARLVAMTPGLWSPTSAALVLVVALLGANLVNGGGRGGAFYLFLVLAPLLPLAGVAVAFGSIGDPAREVTTATPMPTFELLLVRTLAIVAVTTAVTTVAAVPLPHGWQTATWLLPSLGLTAAALALSTWIPAHVAVAGLGGAWALGAVLSFRVNRFDPDVVSRFAALRPAGQLLFAMTTVVCAIVFTARREALDLRSVA